MQYLTLTAAGHLRGLESDAADSARASAPLLLSQAKLASFTIDEATKGHAMTVIDGLTVEKTNTDYEVCASSGSSGIRSRLTVRLCNDRLLQRRARVGRHH